MSPERPIFHSKAYPVFVALCIAALFLASCGLLPVSAPPAPISSTPTSGGVSAATPTSQVLLATPNITTGPATPQVLLVTDTPSVPQVPMVSITQAPMGQLTPTASMSTQQPAGTGIPPTGSIAFTAGTNATLAQGTVQAGQVVTYTLGAIASQPLVLLLDSPNNDVTLGVTEADGTILVNTAAKLKDWQGVLPETELYTIQVVGGATTETFSLTAKLAQLINFASGTSSATVNGTTVSGYPFDYALNCASGQTMNASLNVPASTAYINLWGLVSGTFLRDSDRENAWTGILPETQDYVIEVVPDNGQVVNYALTVSCSGTAAAANNSSSTTPNTTNGSIFIKPGSTAAVEQGTISPGQVVTYTLQGYQYQPLILNVDSLNDDVTLGLLDPNGNPMFNPASKYLNWQVPLHVTGLYTIQVIGGATTEQYTLTAKLPQHVYIGNGTTSVTIKGETGQGFIYSYAINGGKGSILTVSLNISTAYLDIFGVGTGSLLSYKAGAESWTGVLPDSELYVIEVIPRGGWIVDYSLTITIH
ncbi:MAG: hypothetical protein WCE68_10375 [Anaerolineales bacterium]